MALTVLPLSNQLMSLSGLQLYSTHSLVKSPRRGGSASSMSTTLASSAPCTAIYWSLTFLTSLTQGWEFSQSKTIISREQKEPFFSLHHSKSVSSRNASPPEAGNGRHYYTKIAIGYYTKIASYWFYVNNWPWSYIQANGKFFGNLTGRPFCLGFRCLHCISTMLSGSDCISDQIIPTWKSATLVGLRLCV